MEWEQWPRERLLDVRIKDLGLRLEGTWVEGCIDGVTGWSLGAARSDEGDEIADLYVTLERVILPLYYGQRFS